MEVCEDGGSSNSSDEKSIVLIHMPPIMVNPDSKENHAFILQQILDECGVKGHNHSTDGGGVETGTHEWALLNADQGAFTEALIRQTEDDGAGLPARMIMGVSHQFMSITDALLAMAQNLGLHKLASFHTFKNPAQQRAFFGGAIPLQKKQEALLLYLRIVLVDGLIEHWLKHVVTQGVVPSVEDLDAWLHDDTRTNHLKEFSHYAVDLLGAYSTNLTGIRWMDYPLYQSSRKFLLPNLTAANHLPYAKAIVLDIGRVEFQCSSDVRKNIYEANFAFGKPGSGEGCDFHFGEATVRVQKSWAYANTEEAAEMAAAMANCGADLCDTLSNAALLKSRESAVRPITDMSADIAEASAWISKNEPFNRSELCSFSTGKKIDAFNGTLARRRAGEVHLCYYVKNYFTKMTKAAPQGEGEVEDDEEDDTRMDVDP